MTIRVLPSALVHQIAAGEVVERPASVAKELIENSLDAGARRIEVRIEHGGRERLEVRDDGCGIGREDLKLALAAHATSKISSSEDLERISSFGFRGEALCAIASVSHLRVTSRTPASSEGWSIESKFGKEEGPRPAAAPEGTTVEVLELFGNVPARRKFLKADPAEAARITEVVCNAALANPSVAFHLTSGGRTLLDLPAQVDRVGRVHSLMGESLGSDSLEVAAQGVLADGAQARVSGVVCAPASMKAASRVGRIIVNGRPIVDRSLAHAVREAYRGLAEPAMVPIFVIFIDADPTLVDVNVHPQKSEVRWRLPGQMHRLVYKAVQQALLSRGLQHDGSDLLEPGRGVQGDWTADAASWRTIAAHASVPVQHARLTAGAFAVHPQAQDEREVTLLDAPRAALTPVLQVDDTWLVLAEDGAIVIVDQHALHERVMFQEIRDRVARADLMSQRLLVPASAEVEPIALARLDELQGLLRRLGIEVEASGPRSISVHAFPGFLSERRVDPAEFVVRVLMSEQIAAAAESASGVGAKEAALADILDMMACKAAVKGGDRLSQAEMAHLLALRSTTERSSNCPHGRPTSVRIPLAEIEKRFGRR